MASMSYCVFENTNNDLNLIRGMLEEAAEANMTLEQFIAARSSAYERQAVTSFIEKLSSIQDQLLHSKKTPARKTRKTTASPTRRKSGTILMPMHN
jgi:hypothetical protein